MAGKKGAGAAGAGENSKKAAGNAKKAEAASQKAAAENAKRAAAEEEEWNRGAKSNAKRESEAAKKAEAARKKAEKDALLAAEERDAPAGPKNKKTAVKKTGGGRGLDLSQLDDGGNTTAVGVLNATGIDNALDALSLTNNAAPTKVEQHPERRFPAAIAAYTERRLAEMDADGSGKGLRRDQKIERIRTEFKKHPDNPFNQVTARYDATREDLKDIRAQEKDKIEARLAK